MLYDQRLHGWLPEARRDQWGEYDYRPPVKIPSAFDPWGKSPQFDTNAYEGYVPGADSHVYDTTFRIPEALVKTWGGFVHHGQATLPQDPATAWDETDVHEAAIYEDDLGHGRAGHFLNHHLQKGYKEELRSILNQAKAQGKYPMIWYSINPFGGYRKFENGRWTTGDWVYVNVIEPMNRSNWVSGLWTSENPWAFIRELKKYPVYGYAYIPNSFNVKNAGGETVEVSLQSLWLKVLDTYLAKNALLAREISKEWDEELLQSLSQQLEAIVGNELNPQAQKISTEARRVLIGEVELPAYTIKIGSKKRNYYHSVRPAGVQKIAFRLSPPEQQELITSFNNAVNKYIAGKRSDLNAQLARILEKKPLSDAEKDQAQSQERITTKAVTDPETGETVFVSTAKSAAFDQSNMPKTFIPKDVRSNLLAFYKKGEELRRANQLDIRPGADDGGMHLDPDGEGGGILPWIIGGAAAATAAYLSLR